jgi:hypothetical protein
LLKVNENPGLLTQFVPHQDCEVNVLEYWEHHDNGKKQRWV